MGFWNKFNKIGKELPDSKEIFKVPSTIRTTTLNIHLNKIAIRYFSQNFKEVIETIGEINRFSSFSLILFNIPDLKGCIILINDFTYINRSRNNELTVDVCANYPYGIDKNCSLFKSKDVEYQNFRDNILSQDYKLFVPVMLNQIPIPIVKLDDAERLQKIDKNYTKLLANVSQTFLREFIDIKLLQRTGSKNSTGFIYVAILFLVIGAFGGLILSAFLK